MKVTIEKQVSGEEVIRIDMEYDGTSEGWASEVQPALDLLDGRMYQKNLRMLKGGIEVGKLPKTAANAAREILALVHGINLEAEKMRVVAEINGAAAR